MFTSIQKIKKLPLQTKIYCGHEYTKNNLNFCMKYDRLNKKLDQKKEWIKLKLDRGEPTLPVTIEQENETNIFFRCGDPSLKKGLKMTESTEQEIFQKLRSLKDEF